MSIVFAIKTWFFERNSFRPFLGGEQFQQVQKFFGSQFIRINSPKSLFEGYLCGSNKTLKVCPNPAHSIKFLGVKIMKLSGFLSATYLGWFAEKMDKLDIC